jgi:hypothetical protein
MKHKRVKKNIFLTIIIISVVLASSFLIYSYLDFSQKIDSKVLVVEGWIPDDDLSLVVELFKSGLCDRIITVGVPYEDRIENPRNLSGAERSYLYLMNAGIPERNITPVPGPKVHRHNTLTSALFLRFWMKKNISAVDSFNLFTSSVHARKSYIIYKRVFPDKNIGVITSSTLHGSKQSFISSNNWFLSGRGIFLVIKNFFGCFYATWVNIEKVENNLLKQPKNT